ncbi:ABC transporter permease [Pseudonocardia eucalypti]|uniref:Oligopeptide transport system permease protein OppC n=1 Tax=Pseudonocardia eucalypti TaxID=648755 RepID=A0ABP9QA14_9PSEU|nr:peptide/nickel transport system permease protein [Pseudonocardia eucalypti]
MTATESSPSTAPVAVPEVPPGRPAGRGRLVLRRLRRNRLGMAGAVVIVLLFLGAFVSPLLYPWDYRTQDDLALLMPPSPEHWFGTTKLGEDLFAQCMRGLQKSLLIGLLVAVISTAVASVVGALAGYFGGVTDRALMWVVDLLLVLPSFLVVAILSPAFRGKSWLLLVLMLSAFGWMIMSRIVRGMTLTLREREYVLAAKFMGMPAWQIIAKHIIPNMASLLIIDVTIGVGVAILAETSLSFFGFGIQPPDVSLGTLIASGTESALTFNWLFSFPSGLLIVTVLAVNFFGDAVRDALDPSAGRAKAAGRKNGARR